ncbi:endonuclease/exonuclease/phosphatase family protein [Hutsoniella sourekii]|uniref:endonuclease/exonuclease/phosphatase family protein n=1 Tax=Hutsoniella sourekii TaxID=87650 RepID=UPI000488FCC1|nr:endonuclease/exonuclease/phosphatase family protein [Hutsoniella sourekii]
MKLLSLNVHAWIEEDAQAKLNQLIDHLMAEDYDWIALQEVNQTIGAPEAQSLKGFIPTADQQQILADNYAWCLVQALNAQGQSYYWAWAYNHIGYDRYQEGVALLSKQPFQADRVLLSERDDPSDYRTRAALVGSRDGIQVASCHLSWWQEEGGFQAEWHSLANHLEDFQSPTLLLGDFNAPAHLRDQSYDLATERLQDAYIQADNRTGSSTVPSGIDGWSDTEIAQRIDLVLTTPDFHIYDYQSVLDGIHGPIVSDHYGIQVTLDSL